MAFALTLKLIILMLLCVATAVLHFDEYVPLKRKPYCLFIATIFGKVGEEILILARLCYPPLWQTSFIA